MNERLIPMIKQLFRDLGSRQRPGVRRSSGAFERVMAFAKLQRTGALQNALALMMIATVVMAARPALAQWEPLPPLPEPNGGFACGHHGSLIVLVGGTNWAGGKKNWLNHIRHFDSMTKTWKPEFDARLPGGPSAYAAACQVNENRLTLVGGTDGKESQAKLMIIDSIKTSEGSAIKDLGDAVVLSAGGDVSGRTLIVGGTSDAANLAGVTRTTHEIVFIDEPWKDRHWLAKSLADYPGKPFATAASAVVGEELFVFGGMNYDKVNQAALNTAEAYAFSPEKNVWRKLKPLAAPTRGLSAVTLDENHIYIAGGYREDFTAEAVIYEEKTDSYRKAPALPYAAMVGLVKMGEHVYCLGGEDKKQSRTDKFFRIPVAELLK